MKVVATRGVKPLMPAAAGKAALAAADQHQGQHVGVICTEIGQPDDGERLTLAAQVARQRHRRIGRTMGEQDIAGRF